MPADDPKQPADPQTGAAPDPATRLEAQPERLARQIRFLVEIDQLKHVLRQSLVTPGTRRENSAEHSWHLALMALVLHEYANEPVDLERVLKMLLVHDLVEIDAGDTFVYDDHSRAEQQARERQAARRIFGLLPAEQGQELRDLWEEFEHRRTPEARFAAALDRLQPILQNYYTQGATWQRHGVRQQQVLERNRDIAEGSTALWRLVRALVEDAVQRGYLSR